MKQVSRIPSIAFLLLGVLCILFPVHIAGVLPFLLGGIMLVAGVMHGGAYLRNQRFLEGESQGLGPDVVLVVMGVAFPVCGFRGHRTDGSGLGHYRFAEGFWDD